MVYLETIDKPQNRQEEPSQEADDQQVDKDGGATEDILPDDNAPVDEQHAEAETTPTPQGRALQSEESPEKGKARVGKP